MNFNLGNIGHLGLISNENRNIRRGSEYDRLFPLGSPSNSLVTGSEDVFATRRHMIKIVRNSLDETRQIARHLKGSSLQETLKNIYDFLYDHVKYAKDRSGAEHLRSPLETWRDRKGDCDDYSIFISSALSNLGLPHYMRMAKYGGKSNYQHIYIVVPKQSGANMSERKDYYVVDPVVHGFDYEEPFSEKDDLIVQLPREGLQGINTSMNMNQDHQQIRDWLFSSGIANMQNKNSGLMFWYGGFNSYMQRSFPGGSTTSPVIALLWKHTGYDLSRAKTLFMQIAPEFFTSTGADLHWSKVQRNEPAVVASPTTAPKPSQGAEFNPSLIAPAIIPAPTIDQTVAAALPSITAMLVAETTKNSPAPVANDKSGSKLLLYGSLGAVAIFFLMSDKKRSIKPLSGAPKPQRKRRTGKKSVTMNM